jgi:hypothetical protein
MKLRRRLEQQHADHSRQVFAEAVELLASDVAELQAQILTMRKRSLVLDLRGDDAPLTLVAKNESWRYR